MLASQYGSIYRTLWAVGLLASGQVSTIGLTYAGQLLMMGLLNIKVRGGMMRVAM
jgi:Mn2+/Fe2+ NRAMP family transporter